MLPKSQELSETDDVSDFEDIVEEVEEEIIDETEEIHDDDDADEPQWDEDEDDDDVIVDTQVPVHQIRGLKTEKKVVHYDGSPLCSEPDSDIDWTA